MSEPAFLRALLDDVAVVLVVTLVRATWWRNAQNRSSKRHASPVRGLRLVVTTDDYEEALRFYRDTLGLVEQFRQETDEGRVAILDAGLATLEIGDPGNAGLVDHLEVGRRVAGHLRVALEVTDATTATDAAVGAGARLVAPPVRTPWGSVNARLEAPAGLHLTLYTNDSSGSARPLAGGTVGLAEPDPAWGELGRRLAGQARGALGPVARLVAHAGSTAVPGLAAKPVVDLVLAVDDPTDEQGYLPALEALGYTLALREPEWHEHRLLRRHDPAVNLHVFALGSPEVERMLAFRDQLRSDPRDRVLYETTKRELAAREWRVVQDYADAKSAVVREILGRALARLPVPHDTVVLVPEPSGGAAADFAGSLAGLLGLPLLRVATAREVLTATLPAGPPVGPPDDALAAAAAAVVLALAASSAGAVLAGPWAAAADVEAATLPGLVVAADPTRPVAAEARRVRQLSTWQS